MTEKMIAILKAKFKYSDGLNKWYAGTLTNLELCYLVDQGLLFDHESWYVDEYREEIKVGKIRYCGWHYLQNIEKNRKWLGKEVVVKRF